MATAKRLVKKAPTIIQRAYYSLIPFGKRYGKEYVNTSKFLKETLEWSPSKLKNYQFTKLQLVIANAYDNIPYYHKLMVDYGVKRLIESPSDISKLRSDLLVSRKINLNRFINLRAEVSSRFGLIDAFI